MCTAGWRSPCRSSHARPKYFAQIVGELLYWIGEDRITFASDYAIWTPKWLIERFMDFHIPEDLTRVPRAHHRRSRRRSSGSMRRSCTTSRCRGTAGPRRQDEEPSARPGARWPDAGDPERRWAWTVLDALRRSATPSWTSRSPSSTSSGGARLGSAVRGRAAAADVLLCAQLRLPDGGRRLRRRAPSCPAWSRSRSRSSTTSPPTRSTPGWPPAGASPARSRGSPTPPTTSSRSCARRSPARRTGPARNGSPPRCSGTGGRSPISPP